MTAPVSEVRSEDRFREWKLWLKSLPFTLGVFDFWLIYVWISRGRVTLLEISNVVAATAGILIGLSLGLSGLCYFFNVFDRFIIFRKYLGLTGYFLALFYSFLLLSLNPEHYFFGFWNNLLSPDFILGLGAMTILTMMALISTRAAIVALGRYWRPLMRLGYLAYFLLVLRAIVLEYGIWLDWLNSLDSLPPPRLLLSLFAVGVITLRIALQLAKIGQKNTASPVYSLRKNSA